MRANPLALSIYLELYGDVAAPYFPGWCIEPALHWRGIP
jgi:hypothetical protein